MYLLIKVQGKMSKVLKTLALEKPTNFIFPIFLLKYRTLGAEFAKKYANLDIFEENFAKMRQA